MGYGAALNVVAGNYIGVDANGEPLGNGGGINIGNAHDNLIGTNADEVRDGVERNVISANRSYGIWVVGAGPDVVTTGNIIAGNYIGTVWCAPRSHVFGEYQRQLRYRGVDIMSSTGGVVSAVHTELDVEQETDVRANGCGAARARARPNDVVTASARPHRVKNESECGQHFAKLLHWQSDDIRFAADDDL